MGKWTGSGKWAVGASRRKKNARSNGRDRETVGARYGWRSHQRSKMDPSDDCQDRSATAPAAHSGEYSHGRPIAPQTAVLTPREPQEDRPPTPPPPAPLPPHPPTPSAFLPTRQSVEQRRRQ